MRRILPDPQGEVDPAHEYAIPSPTPWVRANMVATVDGAATDPDGLSGGISDPADRRLFKVLRSLADAVVVGVRTAENERYHRAARPVVLLTRTLDLDLTSPLLRSPPSRDTVEVVVVAPDSVPAGRIELLRDHATRVEGVELILLPGTDLDLPAAVAALHARGLRHLLCEGGPTLLDAMVRARVVDELCLTTTPVTTGGRGGRILGSAGTAAPHRWRLAALYEEGGSLFARWRPEPDPKAP